MQHNITLQAGVRTRVELQGSYFVLMDTGAASSVEVALFSSATGELERITEATRGISLDARERFTRLEFTAPVLCTVKVIVSDGRVRINAVEGSTVTASIANLPLPVSPDRGAPASPVHVVGLTYTDAPATALVNAAHVAVNDTLDAIKAADVNCKSVRFTNFGPDPVAIGAAGLTWATRCVVLEVGDTWVEDRAANLAWYAITDAAKSASVGVQAVNA